MNTYTLKDLVTIKNGKDHKHLADGKFPVYGSGGIIRYAESYLYDKPSILLPRKGTLDNIQFCEVPFWTVDTSYYTEVNETLCNPYYLYCYLNLLDLSKLNTGTGVPSMTFDSYYNIKIHLPSKSIQDKIASFLSTLDRKISLNRSINAELERMAKEIYDYWFVQFEFPDANGRPYKSSGGAMVYNPVLKREVPQGWEVKDLDYFLSSVSERTSQIEDSHANYTPIEVIPRKKMSFFETAPLEKAVSGLCKYKRKDVLLSNRRVYFHKVSIVPFNGVTRDTVIILRPNLKDTLEYSFQLVNSEHFIAFATKHSYGSEQPVLSWETARKYKVCAPPKDIVLSYSKKISSCIDSILDNEIESGELTKLRDELLPLLMTGQVKIK